TAPYVVNTEPVDLANNVCRNALITATFDQPMDYNSIASSTFQVGTMRTDGYDCDGNIIVRSDSFLSKIIAFFKKIFFIPLKSYAQTSIFCPIDGKIYLRDINNQTQVTFTPSELLGNKDNAMNYRAIARGELSGVKSALGGIMRSNKIWSFTTSKKVCDIHHTKIDISKRDSVNSDIVTEQDATYDIFACVRDDCPDDISQLPGYDDMPGNQHQYFASAYDKDDTLLAAKFEWAENRYISQGLIDITVPPPPPPDSSISFITPNPIDGKTTLIIKASDANESDGLDYGSASGAITIINSMCKNPWPSPGQMFEDSANNCKPVTGNCNYNMTFASFYCRDFGHQEKYCEDNGSNCQNDSDCPDSQCRDYTYDDLPALSFSHPAPPTILGESNGVCVGGENHDEICANDSSCNNGVCKKVLKDFIFYFPDESDKWCTNSITPCQTDDGCIVGDVCEKNSDIINIKAYSNSEHLSPSAWYKKYVNDQAAYSTAQVDGYQAIVSGRETYINAAIDTDPIGSHSIWTDIFRISYSVKKSEIDGAEEAPNLITQTVFDRFYKNLIFNSDLSGNLQLCQNTTDEWCVKDSDCNPGVVCVAPKDKLARDVVRMGAIGEMVYYLDLYRGYCSNNQHLPCLEDAHCPGYDPADDQSEICISSVNPLYPTLDAGTYISGQAVSVWDKGQGRDSWVETFSSQLGAAISKDPINEVFCPMGYNDECWNEENKEFICGAGSHMFHYFSLNGGLSYNINTSMEYGMATGRSMPWKPVNNHFIANPPQPLCAPAGEETYNLLYDSNR
ncbi:MAG: Ig-like domain-containing protein, partial [Candidatus Kuenenbacteria bacterium]